MKKLLLFACFMLLGGVSIYALEFGDLEIEVMYFDPTPVSDGPNRSPVAKPNISQIDHTLYFNNVGYDLELVLLDEDGEEAYAVFVPANTASVILPASLSGDYELQLYPGGSYYFYSEITL